VSTGGGQTELAILPVRAVTEHHHSELHSRTCNEQNKSYIVTTKLLNYEITRVPLLKAAHYAQTDVTFVAEVQRAPYLFSANTRNTASVFLWKASAVNVSLLNN